MPPPPDRKIRDGVSVTASFEAAYPAHTRTSSPSPSSAIVRVALPRGPCAHVLLPPHMAEPPVKRAPPPCTSASHCTLPGTPSPVSATVTASPGASSMPPPPPPATVASSADPGRYTASLAPPRPLPAVLADLTPAFMMTSPSSRAVPHLVHSANPLT